MSRGTNPGDLAAVVLAAGEGRRLRPLTLRRPKPLCPVGNVALVDHAIARARRLGVAVAVNVHHGRDQLEPHLAAADVHVSVEVERALGTAGALGRLRGWLDGRGAVVVNADTWCETDLPGCLEGWDGERVRLVVAGAAEFGPQARVVASVLPWSHVRTLTEEPTQLYDTTWRPAALAGALDVVGRVAAFFDCGTPASYLAANLHVAAAAGGSLLGREVEVTGTLRDSVVGDGSRVDGVVRSSVLWADAVVDEGEVLDRVVRVSSTMTVAVR